ncbi:MAG: transcriptional regulator [Pseudobdellovibrionaceae bacterium]
MSVSELDRVLHQPVRIRIVALIANLESCDYTTIRDTLELSDGHMTTHMRELAKEKIINVKKQFIEGKPKTTYSLSKDGKKRLSEYLVQLQDIIAMIPSH